MCGKCDEEEDEEDGDDDDDACMTITNDQRHYQEAIIYLEHVNVISDLAISVRVCINRDLEGECQFSRQ